MLAVKICGLASADAVDAAVRGGAVAVGFVLHAASPRAMVPGAAGALARRLPPQVAGVAVVVDPDDALVGEVRAAGFDTIQLHGREPPARVAEIGATGLKVWKALGVATKADLAAATVYDRADALLLDARPPPGATRTGGHGQSFDWSILAGWSAPGPWWLSGGLDASNLARAVAISGAPAVDVSSGVESAPGVKSLEKIEAFLEAARRVPLFRS